MKNILIVCADKELRKDLSKEVSSKLNWLYLDANDILDYEILNRQEIGISDASNELHNMELSVIKRINEFKDKVISISHDLFVSNNNFSLFNDVCVIYVSLTKAYFVARNNRCDKYTLEQELCLFDEIEKLITENSNLTIDKGTKTINELSQEIVTYLEQKKSR